MTRAVGYEILNLFLLHIIFSFSIPQVATAKSSEPLEIQRVRLDSKTINPSKNQKITLSFEVTKSARVQILIYDLLGQKIRSFDMSEVQAGGHAITWDGRKTDGKLAAGDLFLYVIEASDGKSKTVYNPAKETGGLLVKTQEFTFDRKTGKLEYVLPKACMIRLRAGLSNGMLARTILDWQPCTAGRHTYKWDGKDESGLMDLLNHPELDINLTCYTLPANTIIVDGPILPFESKVKYIKAADKETNDPWARKGKYLHYTHDPRNCHEPEFNMSFPNKKGDDKEGNPLISGTTKVRIELDDRDELYLINKRFEIMLYVDGVYFFEMEEGSSPFTFDWNTKGLRKGPHILTINVMSYDGHIGVVSHRVIIGE